MAWRPRCNRRPQLGTPHATGPRGKFKTGKVKPGHTCGASCRRLMPFEMMTEVGAFAFGPNIDLASGYSGRKDFGISTCPPQADGNLRCAPSGAFREHQYLGGVRLLRLSLTSHEDCTRQIVAKTAPKRMKWIAPRRRLHGDHQDGPALTIDVIRRPSRSVNATGVLVDRFAELCRVYWPNALDICGFH